MVKDRSPGSVLFDTVNYASLLAFSLLMIVPFIYVLSGSLASSEEILTRKFIWIPNHFSLAGYQYIFSTKTIFRSLLITTFITGVGTLINLAFTASMAYPLARKNLRWRRGLMLMVIFTILFNGGIIPTFFVVKAFGMLDTYWSLWIPGAISAFNLILLKNFFQNLPESIEESAKIDGCNDLQCLYKIVIPLSMPAITTFSLFYAVGHWNSFFNAILYINDMAKWPIQVWLRQIVILSAGGFTDSSVSAETMIPPDTIKYAVIIVATIPVLLVYPFLQKHFAKGVLLGSVKG
ncbi:carbohydrate ABC transporter permease [Paenibacillus sp. J2TS4]|uniref:carbohydrate ABC transporter permease n=1 Tax=Paenibacillus sp. J2TS4 TaxID=2807194 RepID=UPI001B297531|nr:carbohydrate ABC transporter permease [Paenibacillus sp. J2TS4]GIP31229.1 putative ABC transporter permease protein YtcP [Paenibacillus sp. J2TS4]